MELKRDTAAQCLSRKTYYFSIYPHRCVFRFLWLSENISSFISFRPHISDMVYRISVIMSDAVGRTANEIYCREWWQTLSKHVHPHSIFFSKCAAEKMWPHFPRRDALSLYGVVLAFDGRSTLWLYLKLLRFYTENAPFRVFMLVWKLFRSAHHHALNWFHAFSHKLVFLFRKLCFYLRRDAVGFQWEHCFYFRCLCVSSSFTVIRVWQSGSRNFFHLPYI